MDLLEQLVAEHPGDLKFQSQLARTCHNLGYLHVKLKQRPVALDHYRRSLAVREELARRQPQSREHPRSLAQLHNDIGFALLATDPDAALEANRRALAIREKFARENPTNLDYEAMRASSLNHVADVHRATKRWHEAVPLYEQAIAVQQKVVAANPAVLEYQRNLVNSYDNLGTTHRSAGRPADALRAFQEAVKLQEQIVRTASADYDFAPQLVNLYTTVNDLCIALNRSSEGLRACLRAVAFVEDLSRGRPAQEPMQFAIGQLQRRAGEWQRGAGKQVEAMRSFERGTALLENLLRQSPDVAAYRQEMNRCCYGRAICHYQMKEYESAFADATRALEFRADHTPTCGLLAWFHVLGPERLRDPERGLRLAERAVGQAPGSYSYRRNLGVALYRLGRFQEAIDALRRAATVDRNRPRAVDLFFLAMSHQRLGNAEQARVCYDQALSWWLAQARLSPADLEELKACRAEADQVLKMDETPGRNEPSA
jgi:tetratricopeptide (TPR) repeat protein